MHLLSSTAVRSPAVDEYAMSWVLKWSATAVRFWQRKLKDSYKLLTTFFTPWGRHCYTRLSFGISCAPEHFQKSMQRILEGLPNVECQTSSYMGRIKQNMTQDCMETVLTRLQDANVTLNCDKCEFSKTAVRFLGQLVGKDGIRAGPIK